jgi:hypothetical protein
MCSVLLNSHYYSYKRNMKENTTSKGSRRASLESLPCPFATHPSSLGATLARAVCFVGRVEVYWGWMRSVPLNSHSLVY